MNNSTWLPDGPGRYSLAAALAILLSSCSKVENTPQTDSAAQASASSLDSAISPAIGGNTEWTVRTDGVRGALIGMRSEELRTALGLPPSASASTAECEYMDASGLPVKIFFMLHLDTLVRIDVGDSTIATAEGARIGDSESRIKTLYGDRVAVEPHKYTGPEGHYLIVSPGGDSSRMIVFETDSDRVTTYHVGRSPEVRYVEGCS